MTPRQIAWPREWLMTDERLGQDLWAAIDRLPDGEAGIVLRHYASAAPERRALAEQVAAVCRSRGLTLSIAETVGLAEDVGADLVHKPGRLTRLPISMPVHSLEQAAEARRAEAALVFVSPVFATRSHPDSAPLGPAAAAALARAVGVPAIALGGMDRERFATLPGPAFYGWAGIDAWIR